MSAFDLLKKQLDMPNKNHNLELNIALAVLQANLSMVIDDCFFGVTLDFDDEGHSCFRLSIKTAVTPPKDASDAEITDLMLNPDHSILVKTHLNTSGRNAMDTLVSIMAAVKEARSVILRARGQLA
jgi:hypothetical protein